MSDTNKKTEVKTLGVWLKDNRQKFAESLPASGVPIERFLNAARNEIGNNPKLQLCTRKSLAESLITSALYGLEVGGLLGQAYLIPYNENKQLANGQWDKVMTCHFQMGYKGLIVLARRSQTIKTICAEIVYSNDQFEARFGLHPDLTHTVDIKGDRGSAVGYYAAVELMNGGSQFAVMTKKEAEGHRDRYSKGFGQKPTENPWATNFDAMALKTCIIKVLKLCPMSVETLEAVNREERGLEMRTVTESLDDIPAPSEDGGKVDEEETVATTEVKVVSSVAKARTAAAIASGKTITLGTTRPRILDDTPQLQTDGALEAKPKEPVADEELDIF